MIEEDYCITVAKKQMQKAIINELHRKKIIDFSQYNCVINKLNEDIAKLQTKFEIKDEMKKIVIDVML